MRNAECGLRIEEGEERGRPPRHPGLTHHPRPERRGWWHPEGLEIASEGVRSAKGCGTLAYVSSTKRPLEATGVRNERAPDALLCLRCGYALRGLPLAGVCPECEYGVKQSMPGGLLEGLDVDGLGRVRASLGLWSAALILLLLVWPATTMACPQIANSTDKWGFVWTAGHAAVWAVTAGVVSLAWLPLIGLRKRSGHAWVRRSALAAPLCLFGSGLAGAFVVVALWRSNVYVGWLGPSLWPWVWLGAAVVRDGLLAVFFVAGSRYSLELSHLEAADLRSRRWTVWLGVLGALAPFAGIVLTVPRVEGLLLTWGVPASLPGAAERVLGLGGGFAVAAACLAWAGAWGRVERCTVGYVEALQAERLKEQLDGTA